VLDPICGQPLGTWCAQQQLSVDDRLRLFLQVVRAVAYVHSHGVVHRDLKPSNVLVSGDGQAHVLDFGIACNLQTAGQGESTASSERSLTPAYASPEQIRGAGNSFASDIYSLGVMLFELLTGQLPHARETGFLSAANTLDCGSVAPLASSRVKDASAASRLRGPVDALLHKAISPQPEHRHSTATILADAIERLLSLQSSYQIAAPALESAHRISRPRLVGSNDSISRQRRHSADRRRALGSPARHKPVTPLLTGRC
jgi:eukaryotic-like serine/threonine-protein kinase